MANIEKLIGIRKRAEIVFFAQRFAATRSLLPVLPQPVESPRLNLYLLQCLQMLMIFVPFCSQAANRCGWPTGQAPMGGRPAPG